MSHLRRLWVIAPVVALLACDRSGGRVDQQVPRPTPVAQVSQATSGVADTSFGFLTQPIAATTTFGTWMASHPSDSVSTATATNFPEHITCRTAVSRQTASGIVLTRMAIFALPHVTEGEVLPADTANLPERTCRLVAIWLEGDEKDSVLASHFAESVAAILRQRLGAPTTDDFAVHNTGIGGGRWINTASWVRAVGVIAVGVQPPVSEWDIPQTVVVGAYALHRGIYPDRASDAVADAAMSQAPDPSERSDTAVIDSAIQWAALPAATPDLRAIAGYVADENRRAGVPRLDSALSRVLAVVQETAPKLPADQRAAAYLAADIAAYRYVTLSYRWGRDTAQRLFRMLDSTEFKVEMSEMDGPQARRPWLSKAIEADPNSRAGRAAFIMLLGHETPPCEDLAAYHHRIESIQSAMSSGNSDPMLQKYVGDGYATLFSFSFEKLTDAVALEVKRGAADARRRAIDAYRVALAGLRDRESRTAVWNAAMRVLLGLPNGAMYACGVRD